jgi:curved DNA-binding protein CbpA
MDKGDDPYRILGVEYTATEDEIKKAYRKGALKNHPDKQTTDEERELAHDIFAKLSAAYDVLTDPVKRYDWKSANEDKLKRSKSDSSSSQAAPPQRPPPPRRQNTDPAPRPPPRKNSAPPPSTAPHFSKPPPPPPTRTTPPQSRTPPQRRPRGAKPPPQQRKTAAAAPPPAPPSNAFSWTRSKEPNPKASAKPSTASSYPSAAGRKENLNVPNNSNHNNNHHNNTTKAAAASSSASAYPDGGTGKKETVKKTSNHKTKDNSYPSAAAAGKKENPSAPNTSYSAGGMKEDLRSPTDKKKRTKAVPSSDSSTYSTAGVGTKEDLRSPPGRSRKRNAIPSSSATTGGDTSYGGAGVGTKEDFRSPTGKKIPKKRVRTPRKNVTTATDTSYSAKPNIKEDPNKIESSYSLSGANGYPVERTYTPPRPKRGLKAAGAASISGPPLSNDSDHGTVSSRQTYAAGQERAPRERAPRRGSGSSAPGRKSRHRDKLQPLRVRSRSQSPRKGGPADFDVRAVRVGSKKKANASNNEVHDPFQTFEKIVRLEFGNEDFVQKNPTGDWVAKGLFGVEKKETKLKAKALDYYDPNAVMSMSTSTKTEKRKEDGLYDVKTITKILRGDGSVETVRQASVCDRERSKTIPKDKTVTVTREATKSKKKKK